MNEKNKTDQYIDHINSHILPFVDYHKLQESYGTDMVYAKGILNRLHEAMVSVYGSIKLDETDGDDGFVIIPGAVRGRDSGNVCVALLELDVSSSGEHWGTSYLCKYGVISQSGGGEFANNNNKMKSETKEINAAFLPYDYAYTAVIPDDIHVDADHLPEALKSMLSDFQNHRAELLNEKKPQQAGKSADANIVDGVTTVRISSQEFKRKMQELLPDASAKAIKQLISYAAELDECGTHPGGAFFSETYVNFNFAARDYGANITGAVLKVCEESCLNPWEIRDAARLMAGGASQSDIVQKTTDGSMDYEPEHWDEVEKGLDALKNGTLTVPTIKEKQSVIKKIRSAEKNPKEPRASKPTQKKKEPGL